MKKRLLSVFLCLCMVFGLVPATVWAETTNGHTHYLCGGSTCNGSGHENETYKTTFEKEIKQEGNTLKIGGESWTPTKGSNDTFYILPTGTYYLGSDISLEYTIKIENNVTLCLNGHKITAADGMDAIYMTGGSFTLTDCKGVGTITHASSKTGRGVYVSSGTFNMYGGSITGNKAQDAQGRGGGVYVYSGSGTFNMYGGSITGNRATGDGGGVYKSGSNSSFNMYGGSITGNTANSYGGGVYVGTGQFTMEGGSITGCQANGGSFGKGGGVYNCDGQFTMIGGIIEGNCTASGSGGGVYNAKVLFANGGEIAGDVMNGDRYPSGTITGSGGTRFSGKVINNKNEDGNKSIIECGTFTGEVSNEGEIIGGDFSQANLSGTLVITFDPDNGDQSSTKEVHLDSDGAALTPPDPTPTKEGYTLDGWYWYYNNNGAETKWNFDTDKARYTMTLKAKWTKNTTPIIPGNGTNNIVEQYKTDDSSSGEQTDREVPSPVVKNATSYMTYTVQTGDTLWKIARKYNCSITEIMAANSDRIKNPNRIHAGWQLKIPQSGAPITGSTPDAVLPENRKSGIYIVRQGDTLWKIARKYNCSVAEIVSLNRELIRNPALIYSGWELKVPQD